MKKLLVIPIAFAHWVLCIALHTLALSADLDRPRVDVDTAQVLAGIGYIVTFPTSVFLKTVEFSTIRMTPFEPWIWALNSLLWGVALYYGGGWLYRQWRGRTRPEE